MSILSSGVKWPGREDGHSKQPSAEAKYESSYASTPAVCLHDVHMDKFTLTFTFAIILLIRSFTLRVMQRQ